MATKESSKKSAAAKVKTAKAVKKPSKAVKNVDKKRRKLPIPKFLRAIGGYFKGAWQELRQVRWPNRRATWGLTLAVILFTLFWVGVIIGLDAIYDYVFNELIL